MKVYKLTDKTTPPRGYRLVRRGRVREEDRLWNFKEHRWMSVLESLPWCGCDVRSRHVARKAGRKHATGE